MEVYILDSEIVFRQENAQRREEDVFASLEDIQKERGDSQAVPRPAD